VQTLNNMFEATICMKCSITFHTEFDSFIISNFSKVSSPVSPMVTNLAPGKISRKKSLRNNSKKRKSAILAILSYE